MSWVRQHLSTAPVPIGVSISPTGKYFAVYSNDKIELFSNTSTSYKLVDSSDFYNCLSIKWSCNGLKLIGVGIESTIQINVNKEDGIYKRVSTNVFDLCWFSESDFPLGFQVKNSQGSICTSPMNCPPGRQQIDQCFSPTKEGNISVGFGNIVIQAQEKELRAWTTNSTQNRSITTEYNIIYF